MVLGTWNVQSLSKKREIIIKDIEQLKLDLVALTETKKKGSGSEMIGKFAHFYSGVPKDQRAKRGVSIIMKRKLSKNITDWESIDENLIRVNLNWMQRRISIVGVYAPSDDEPVSVKDEFYNKLNEVIGNIGSTRELFMLGDFNGRTARRNNHKIVGPYGEETDNDNGRRLIEICEYNNLTIKNGFFQHKDIHKYTWTQPTRNLRSIIDYVIARQRNRLTVQDVRVLRGTGNQSDHYLVRSKIFIPYHKTNQGNRIEETKDNTGGIRNVKYNLQGLMHDSVKYLYQKRLNEKLTEDPELSFEDIYNNITESIHDAAKEALGIIENQKSKNLWWTFELEQLVKEKKILYLKWLSSKSEEDRQIYIEKKNEVRRTVNAEKNRMWDRKCQEVNTYIGGRRNTEVWRFIRANRTEKRETVPIQLVSQDEWITHYKNLLSETREEYKTELQSQVYIQGEEITVEIENIKKSVRLLKNGRACGPQGIYPELIKCGTEKLYRMLRNIMNQCLNGHPVPQEWKQAYISSIHKKGSKKDPNNYRGISVTSTISRIYGRILRDLIEEENSRHEEEEQSGFRAGRSCTDNVFCLKQIIEKKTSINQEVHITFIDLQKAYDTVPIVKLWEALQESNINHTIIKALQNLYEGSTARINMNNKLSTEFEVSKGLRQGCCVSPTLFKIFIAKALQTWKRKCHGMGIELNEGCLYNLQFADDQAIISNDKEDMEYMVRKLIEEYGKYGLTVNTEKTKYLCIGGLPENLEIDNNKIIATCNEYKYLGISFNREGTDDQEINRRVVQARKIIGCLNGLLWSGNITKRVKFNIYETMIKSTLLYGCETWRITEGNRKKVEATEMDAIRRAMRISRTERIRNEEVKRRMGIEGTIMEDITRKQLIWYGHVRRMDNDRLPKQTMEWIPAGRRRRGRPKKSWIQGIRKSISERNLTENQCYNRKEWKLGIGQRRKTF